MRIQKHDDQQACLANPFAPASNSILPGYPTNFALYQTSLRLINDFSRSSFLRKWLTLDVANSNTTTN